MLVEGPADTCYHVLPSFIWLCQYSCNALSAEICVQDQRLAIIRGAQCFAIVSQLIFEALQGLGLSITPFPFLIGFEQLVQGLSND